MHFDTKKLTRCALIAAIYVALTMLSNALNLAYGPIQLRFSEAPVSYTHLTLPTICSV